MRTHPLPPPGFAYVMQDLKLLFFNVQWFRDLGASLSSFGCFVFEIWVLRSSFSSASFSKLPVGYTVHGLPEFASIVKIWYLSGDSCFSTYHISWIKLKKTSSF